MRLGPHPFSLRQLQYAVAVADARSFRGAAATCHVSQPSLSAQLAALEEALGVRLFERDRRRVLQTAAGDELIARMRRLLLEVDDLGEAAQRLGDPLAGTLRVGVIPTISPYLLPMVAPLVRRRHPQLTVLWIEDKTEVLVASLAAGTLDAALLALEARLGDLEREVIADDPFVLVGPAGHELVRPRSAATADDLRGAPVLLLDEGHCLREQALSICSTARAEELSYRATSLSTLVQVVAGGAGVTLLPRLAVPSEAQRADLGLRRFAAPAPGRTIGLVWRRGSATRPALTQMAATIREACQKAEPRLERALARR